MRAVGYSFPETTWEWNTEAGRYIVTKIVEKHYPPDVNACKVWLYSRCPEEFRPETMSAPGSTKGDVVKAMKTIAERLPG
jgi:hypothetical protein